MSTHVDDQADGRLDRMGEGWQLRFVRTLAHPREKVWRAIAEPEHRDAWFPQQIEIDGPWEAGAKLRFVSETPGGSFDGEVYVYDPPQTLDMRWGTDRVRFDLAAEGDHTVLTLVSTLGELGTAARTGAGWHTCLDMLGFDLDGAALPWTGEQRWRQVHPAYVRQFGPEAATIGPPAGHPVLDEGS
ncbi:MAG TPA: SRPBCC domain-containing protein [Streptosporangiaceae bacterium]